MLRGGHSERGGIIKQWCRADLPRAGFFDGQRPGHKLERNDLIEPADRVVHDVLQSNKR